MENRVAQIRVRGHGTMGITWKSRKIHFFNRDFCRVGQKVVLTDKE